MPYWSITEWRAHIGSSWCALGRPFKTRSPFRGKVPRGLTLSQGLTTMLLLILSIGVNLGLRALIARGHHLPLLSEWHGQFVGSVSHSLVHVYSCRFSRRWHPPSQNVFDQSWAHSHSGSSDYLCIDLPIVVYGHQQLKRLQW